MPESLFTGQTPVTTNGAEGAPGITTATSLLFATDGQIEGVRFFATTMVGGTYTAEVYRVTASDVDQPGTGTLLASKAVSAAGITPGAWNVITLDTPVEVLAGLDNDALYRVALHNSEGRYVSTNNFFSSEPLINGNITAPIGDPFGGFGSIYQGTFLVGAAGAYPNTQFGQSSYFVDVVFEEAVPEGVAAFTLALALETAGDAPGVPPGAGSGDLGITLTLAATGRSVGPSEGSAAFVLSLAAAATGDAPAPAPSPAGVCGWGDIDPVALGVCEDWESRPEAIRDTALALASRYLWAATGRQYGVCPVTIRPQQGRCAPHPAYQDFPSAPGRGADGAGPYLYAGRWYNGGCGTGCCGDGCGVVLRGPVGSMPVVVLDGETLPESAYRVDVHRGAYLLMRTDGGCWPTCALEPGSFEVTYGCGTALPLTLEVAVAQLACEYAKHLAGGACALPARMTRLSRQGVEVEVDAGSPAEGTTGIAQVDAVIASLNPGRRQSPPVVWSPDLADGNDRMTIWG